MAEVSEKQWKEGWAKITAKAWEDSAYKNRLLREPDAVMAEAGIPMPAGYHAKVVDESSGDAPGKYSLTRHDDDTHTVVMRLSAKPQEVAEGELSDSQLEAVAGGGDACCCCSPCCTCT